MKIPFNKPYFCGKELGYIQEAMLSGKVSGDGAFTRKCQRYFESRFEFRKTLLTTSCTDALEMAAILSRIQPGDEVIAPSYTFVSTVNAFVLRGAKIVFADSRSDQPNIDANTLDSLVTERTKAVVVVHYAGVACEMDIITSLASKYGLLVIEDAAHAFDAFYKGSPLGSIGQLSAFSFHETKNIISGEGGMLVINDADMRERAEIIREKGTNRSAFFRGEIDKYEWVDIGSSFLPSEMIAAVLYAQLQASISIQSRRLEIWNRYWSRLTILQEDGLAQLPVIPEYATNNAHMFYLVCRDETERKQLIAFLNHRGIHAAFHYQALHASAYFSSQHDGRILEQSERYTDCLLRLPLFVELTDEEVDLIANTVIEFYLGRGHY